MSNDAHRLAEHGGSVGSEVLSPTSWRAVAHSLHLSDRELQVVHGVFDDVKDVCIAHRIGISHHTVHTYPERIYHKLGVHSRASLIVRVFAEHQRLNGDGQGEPAYS